MCFARVCLCVSCVCVCLCALNGVSVAWCACLHIKLFDFGFTILFVKSVDIKMKCNARLIDSMICLIVMALKHITWFVSARLLD